MLARHEQQCDLYITFFNLTKAFDTVNRDDLWKIMEKFGCLSKFIALVRQFHDGMILKVLEDGEESDPFPVTNSVKLSCVLAPTQLSMIFSAMLPEAFGGCDDGITIRYRTSLGACKLSQR